MLKGAGHVSTSECMRRYIYIYIYTYTEMRIACEVVYTIHRRFEMAFVGCLQALYRRIILDGAWFGPIGKVGFL